MVYALNSKLVPAVGLSLGLSSIKDCYYDNTAFIYRVL